MHIKAKLGQENLLRMVRWLRWHCPPDTGFEICTLAVWGRARYLSVTEAPHNTDFHTWMGGKHFLFLSNRRDREPNPKAWKAAVLTTTLGPPPPQRYTLEYFKSLAHCNMRNNDMNKTWIWVLAEPFNTTISTSLCMDVIIVWKSPSPCIWPGYYRARLWWL